jgi:hypothetical protein
MNALVGKLIPARQILGRDIGAFDFSNEHLFISQRDEQHTLLPEWYVYKIYPRSITEEALRFILTVRPSDHAWCHGDGHNARIRFVAPGKKAGSKAKFPCVHHYRQGN